MANDKLCHSSGYMGRRTTDQGVSEGGHCSDQGRLEESASLNDHQGSNLSESEQCEARSDSDEGSTLPRHCDSSGDKGIQQDNN